MPRADATSLKPRKAPAQSRSRVTVDAIFEATIQVLIRDGMKMLTTTRVAERAGVSVGTMYQYFPNKQALVHALNERYLTRLAERIESVCQAQAGKPVDRMVEALIETYWQAKTEREDLTRALYRSVAELETDRLVHAFAARVDEATEKMFASARDIELKDVATTNLTLATVIYGAVRNIFERDLSRLEAEGIKQNLILMCRAYLAGFTRTENSPGDRTSGA